MKTHIITIGIPPAELSANSTAHHFTVGRLRKVQHQKVVGVIKYLHPELMDAMWETATIKYVFYWSCERTRDDDNSSSRMKAARDAFGPTLYWKSGKREGQIKRLGAGVIQDDSGFTELPLEQHIDPAEPRVEIHITNTTGDTQ